MNTVFHFGKRSARETFLCDSDFYRACASIPMQNTGRKTEIDAIQPALDYFETHCTEKVDIQYASQLCFMSKSNLRRHFQREIGMSPLAYRNKLRIEKSKELILYSDLNFTQIAQFIGFNNVYEFSVSFKKHVGITPTQFLKNKINSRVGVFYIFFFRYKKQSSQTQNAKITQRTLKYTDAAIWKHFSIM